MTTLARKPIETVIVEPAIDREATTNRPTEIRYGWCPFDKINLIGADGTPCLFVQPQHIETPKGAVHNPYFGSLPQRQLIPFPTFSAPQNVPSPDRTDSNGRALLIQGTQTITAIEAVVSVLRGYSAWGFTILAALQGVEQSQAMRIFRVVQPLDYLLYELENELTFGASERIDATDPIVFSPDYAVKPLRSDAERDTARQLASQMADGAGIAYTLATTILDETEASMTQRFAGGQGKATPDPLDLRLCIELNRALPKLIGNQKGTADLGEIKEQIAFLASREASRADKEKILELEAKIARMESGELAALQDYVTAIPICPATKADGTHCKARVKNTGELCTAHQPKEAVTDE